MSQATARNLSNDFRDISLLSLQQWPGAAALATPGGHGPYVAMQEAIDPEDLKATAEDFILSKDGRWLPLYLFQPLPQDLRRERFLFASAAEVIGVLQGLTGKPVIERGTGAPPEPEGTASEDPLNRAINEARKGGTKAS